VDRSSYHGHPRRRRGIRRRSFLPTHLAGLRVPGFPTEQEAGCRRIRTAAVLLRGTIADVDLPDGRTCRLRRQAQVTCPAG